MTDITLSTYKCELPKYKCEIPKKVPFVEIEEWLTESCQGDYFWDIIAFRTPKNEIYFKSEEDATLFNMRWG